MSGQQSLQPTVPPTVRGILETALNVADIRKAAAFYKRLFGFETLFESERLIALNVAGKSVLLLFPVGATQEPLTLPGGVIPGHGARGSHHFAFAISAEDLEPWTRRLESEGVAIEGAMTWDGGAKSIYFRDPDGNLAELITPGFWKIY